MDICISNIGLHVSRYDIRQLFEPFGSVQSVEVVTDHRTGASCGFARIKMRSRKAAEKAIDILDGIDIEGQFVSVAPERVNLSQ
ncbi:RNA-binding protein [Terrimonas sp. NA20]|uniref:RNA-binding protein n=1 Tax=Terrimonas ginsenosidimutans TaxID=2908004 RepID=A0ABS9KS67_9BACT|nr:RNA-binding protein [Terrimonas ginsenosidimutans]MCG2615137.1 RNA-binding protein [Terrimonas ginsenosidimutans]